MGIIERDFSGGDHHPIDIVERLATTHDWDFDRVAEDQIAMAIEGTWRTYSVTLAWSDHDETLRVICAFEMEVPRKRVRAMTETMQLANDKCWLGAFTRWADQKLMVYRYGLNLAGGAEASMGQIDDIMRAAVSACERFFPAFQLVAWGNETPERAMGIAMTDAYGRA